MSTTANQREAIRNLVVGHTLWVTGRAATYLVLVASSATNEAPRTFHVMCGTCHQAVGIHVEQPFDHIQIHQYNAHGIPRFANESHPDSDFLKLEVTPP